MDLPASINGLTALWNEILQSYEAHVMQQQQLDPRDAVIAHEQVHWLLLIGGHLIADEAEGEDTQIPEEVQSLAAKVGMITASHPTQGETPCVARGVLLLLTLLPLAPDRRRPCAAPASRRTCSKL